MAGGLLIKAGFPRLAKKRIQEEKKSKKNEERTKCFTFAKGFDKFVKKNTKVKKSETPKDMRGTGSLDPCPICGAAVYSYKNTHKAEFEWRRWSIECCGCKLNSGWQCNIKEAKKAFAKKVKLELKKESVKIKKEMEEELREDFSTECPRCHGAVTVKENPKDKEEWIVKCNSCKSSMHVSTGYSVREAMEIFKKKKRDKGESIPCPKCQAPIYAEYCKATARWGAKCECKITEVSNYNSAREALNTFRTCALWQVRGEQRNKAPYNLFSPDFPLDSITYRLADAYKCTVCGETLRERWTPKTNTRKTFCVKGCNGTFNQFGTWLPCSVAERSNKDVMELILRRLAKVEQKLERISEAWKIS